MSIKNPLRLGDGVKPFSGLLGTGCIRDDRFHGQAQDRAVPYGGGVNSLELGKRFLGCHQFKDRPAVTQLLDRRLTLPQVVSVDPDRVFVVQGEHVATRVQERFGLARGWSHGHDPYDWSVVW